MNEKVFKVGFTIMAASIIAAPPLMALWAFTAITWPILVCTAGFFIGAAACVVFVVADVWEGK